MALKPHPPSSPSAAPTRTQKHTGPVKNKACGRRCLLHFEINRTDMFTSTNGNMSTKLLRRAERWFPPLCTRESLFLYLTLRYERWGNRDIKQESKVRYTILFPTSSCVSTDLVGTDWVYCCKIIWCGQRCLLVVDEGVIIFNWCNQATVKVDFLWFCIR